MMTAAMEFALTAWIDPAKLELASSG